MKRAAVEPAVPAGVSDRWAPYPFPYKEAQYRGLSDAALFFHLEDARQTVECWRGVPANREGLSPEGWYQDDVNTIAREIQRRRDVAAGRRRAGS